MRLTWIDDPSAFLERDWTPLVERDPDGTFFHTPRYLRSYVACLEPRGVRLAVVGDPDAPVAVCGFELSGRTLAFLGGMDVTDYLGPVGLPAERDRAAHELVAAIAADPGWDTADLRGLPEDGEWVRVLAAAASARGLDPVVEPEVVAPFLQLQPTYEEYLASLAGKLRHEIRRKRRRLLDRFPDAVLVDTTGASIDADVERFIELHRASPGEKGRFMTETMAGFFRRLVGDLLPEGHLRLANLRVRGETVAAAIGFRDRDRFLLYNSAFDPERGETSPGMVLLDLLIEDVIREGFRAMDMLKGDVEYKYRFGARPRRIDRIVLRRH